MKVICDSITEECSKHDTCEHIREHTHNINCYDLCPDKENVKCIPVDSSVITKDPFKRRKVVDYNILEDYSKESLIYQVKAHLEKEWELQCGVSACINDDNNSTRRFCQAMVMYDS